LKKAIKSREWGGVVKEGEQGEEQHTKRGGIDKKIRLGAIPWESRKNSIGGHFEDQNGGAPEDAASGEI